MLSHYTGPIGTAATIFPFIAGLILLPMILVHYWRFGRLQRLRALVFYSFLFYVLAAYFLVILPLPDRFEGFCAVYEQTKTPRLQPFAFIADTLEAGGGLQGLPSNPAFLQAFFNFLLLLPLGFYLRYYFRFGFVRAGLIAFGATLFFELTQLSGLYGTYPCPYRLFDVDDLILNTGGALLGYGMAALMPFLPDLNRVPEGPIPVTIVRRSVAFLLDALLYGMAFSLIYGILFPPDSDLASNLETLTMSAWFMMIPAVWHGYTPGKRLVFLRIVSCDGTRAALWQLVIRYSVLIYAYPLTAYVITLLGLPAFVEFLAIAAVTLAYLWTVIGWSLIRRDGRGLHDRMARTRQVVTWQRDTQVQQDVLDHAAQVDHTGGQYAEHIIREDAFG